MKKADLNTGKTSHGEALIIKPSSFYGGIAKYSFELGEDFNISKTQSSATLRFVSDVDIYYSFKTKDKLLVAAGEDIQYFSVLHTWSGEQHENGVAIVYLDLRPPGVYGKEFDTSKITDGKGNFGDELIINATPTFEYFES